MVAEIEDVRELLAGLDLFGDLQLGVIEPHQLWGEFIVRIANPAAIAQLEGMQMRQIPPRERRVDRARELLKGMRRADQKDATRRRIQRHATTTEQVHPDPKPGPSHRPDRLRRF